MTSEPERPVRVVVVDDEPLVRSALEAVIALEPRLELVGEADGPDSAREVVVRSRPDVALVDVKMPSGGGVRLARELRKHAPATRVVALSAFTDRVTILEMLRAGAVGYVAKGSPAREIVEAVLDAMNGGSRLSGEAAGEVLGALATQFADEERNEARRQNLVTRITELMGEGSVTTAFQPIVDLGTLEPVGFEALSRFPADFPNPAAWFEAADSVGLRTELEVHAAQLACARLSGFPENVFVSINLSPDALGRRPCREVDREARSRIVLEITEHAPVDDYDTLADALAEARADGVRIAVDDAGAGFASLRHILTIGPDLIKLDRSLIDGIHEDRSRRALARALISFASELGTTIVAEGVETEAQLAALRALGVQLGQGFLFGRPAPLEAVRART